MYEQVTTITSYEEEKVYFDKAYEASALDPCTIISSYEEEQLSQKIEDFNISEVIEEEGLKYIAGYVAFRFKNIDKTLGIETRQLETTSDQNSVIGYNLFREENVCIRVTNYYKCAHIMNIEFAKYHGSSLNKKNFVFQNLAKIIEPQLKIKIPREVLLCLIRTRTYIRLREINRAIAITNHRRKQKRCQN